MRRLSLAARTSFFTTLKKWTLCTCLATSLLGGSLQSAQADDDALSDLKRRLEQLEQDNRELRLALTQRTDDSFVPLIADLPPSPDDVVEGVQESDDQKKMGSLVEGYMRRMEAQSQAMFDAQNQKISALESKLNSKPKPTSATGNYGNGGLVFTSADGNFKTHFGGTAQLDFISPQSHAMGIGGFGAPGGNQDLTQDSTNFRRLRMRADGTMYGNIDWVSEFDFAGFVQNTSQTNPNLADNGLRGVPGTGAPGFLGQQGGNSLNVIQPTTVWMTFKEIPVAQNIRVGNQQDWFSIEHITSARYLDFMERAPIMDVFSGPNNNGYTPGVSAFGNLCEQSVGYQMGIYKNNAYDSGYTFSVGNAFTYGGRMVWTPYYEEDGKYLLHTAFGSEYRTFDTDTPLQTAGTNVRLRSRGDLRIVSATLTPNFADTGNFFATGQSMIDPEIAVVWGPWTFQAEYTAGWFQGARTTNLPGGNGLGNVFMYGGYAEVLYFLTGEHKSYNRQTGLFNQVVPLNNVNFCEGKYGAWQVGARYDYMDLNSGLITGGMNQNGTLGLNWFLNPNVRFQFNVVLSYVNNNATPAINPAAGAPGSAAATSGAVSGAKFTGEGLLTTVGTRMDISF